MVLSKEILKMYEREFPLCANCRLENKSPPLTYWNLGINFEITYPKIAFVGKNAWGSGESSQDKVYDEGYYLIKGDRKKGHFFYDINTESSYSRFWSCVKKITKIVQDIKINKCAFLNQIYITNLCKCNIVCDDYINITSKDYFTNCSNIFEKEIEILQPTHIIFFVNTYYDELLENLDYKYNGVICDKKDVFNNEILLLKTNNKDQSIPWWHRVYYYESDPILHFLRTRHPQGAFSEMEDEIIKWIRHNTV